MRWLLLVLLLLPAPAHTAPLSVKHAERFIFRTVVPKDAERVSVGTAFCLPGTAAPRLVTAGHTTGPGLFVLDYKYQRHDVKVYFEDEKRDMAILILDADSKVCDLNPFQWAKRSPDIGDDIWIVGLPAGMLRPLTRKGTLASGEDFIEEIPGRRASTFHAIQGDSGAPVFDSAGNVIGIEQGGTKNGIIDFYLPVEQIRKVIK